MCGMHMAVKSYTAGVLMSIHLSFSVASMNYTVTPNRKGEAHECISFTVHN